MGHNGNYHNQEHTLNRLLHHTYPRNNDLDEVLVKVARVHFLGVFSVLPPPLLR